MDHRGIEYQVVQTANPSGYRWTIQLDAMKTRTGTSASKGNAIFQVARVIDTAIKAKSKTETAAIASR
jgi:hypothetical protein